MQRNISKNLLDWKNSNNRKPLILKGVRQVGKTYILKELGRTHFPKCHYFNFETTPLISKFFEKDLSPKRILQELSFQAESSINIQEDLVIFDEIQECPKALTSLNYFAEECSELHLCAAGSLLGLNLNAGSFPVGKVTFETLRPLSFEEFLRAADQKGFSALQNIHELGEAAHAYLWDLLKIYFVVGGLPEVVATYCDKKEDLFEALTHVRKKQDDLLQSYYADIAKHSGKVNAMHIDRIFKNVPAQLSQKEAGGLSRFKFKGVIPGVSHYDRLSSAIDWLEAAGLVIKIAIANTGNIPFLGHTKESFFKLMLFDIGILGKMADIPPKVILDADYGSYKGYFAENFVAMELLSMGQSSLYSWQEGLYEVDFLLEKGGAVLPIEVKAGKTINAKSLKVFSEKYQPPHQIILSGQPPSESIDGKIHYYPLYLIGKSHFD